MTPVVYIVQAPWSIENNISFFCIPFMWKNDNEVELDIRLPSPLDVLANTMLQPYPGSLLCPHHCSVGPFPSPSLLLYYVRTTVATCLLISIRKVYLWSWNPPALNGHTHGSARSSVSSVLHFLWAYPWFGEVTVGWLSILPHLELIEEQWPQDIWKNTVLVNPYPE